MHKYLVCSHNPFGVGKGVLSPTFAVMLDAVLSDPPVVDAGIGIGSAVAVAVKFTTWGHGLPAGACTSSVDTSMLLLMLIWVTWALSR